ncbi:hypothetical protein ATANTOWER_022812 [Ataeniobius toweri]|uniref:Uncharacterized protein n=1 Tax=Ataeniobius toweri TaxID=208326 RepID=A0ABU7BH63_9TELE|nr:hypothetical protein [Ataeniobius toweri]
MSSDLRGCWVKGHSSICMFQPVSEHNAPCWLSNTLMIQLPSDQLSAQLTQRTTQTSDLREGAGPDTSPVLLSPAELMDPGRLFFPFPLALFRRLHYTQSRSTRVSTQPEPVVFPLTH